MIYVVSLIALALLVFSCCSLKNGNDGGKGLFVVGNDVLYR